jgi:hypothetical protein
MKWSIAFLKDAKNKDFIIKYHPHTKRAIHETIATQVGETVGININHVEVFPKQSSYFLDSSWYLKDIVATLHTIVPGCEAYKTSIYEDLTIEGGLSNSRNLETIAQFVKLSDIIALDIFTNNPDRHCGNIFINQRTKRIHALDPDFFIDQKKNPQFYAIDMNYSFSNIVFVADTENELHDILFKNLLATKAYDFLEEEEIAGKKFLPQEIKALRRVNKVLDKMIKEWSPEKLYNEWMNVADKINYSYTPGTKENIKIALEYNFHEVKRLRSKIDELTKQ